LPSTVELPPVVTAVAVATTVWVTAK